MNADVSREIRAEDERIPNLRKEKMKKAEQSLTNPCIRAEQSLTIFVVPELDRESN